MRHLPGRHDALRSAPNARRARAPAVTAQQYLQSQAELCRRTADDTADPLAAEDLRRRAVDLDRRAQEAQPAVRAA